MNLIMGHVILLDALDNMLWFYIWVSYGHKFFRFLLLSLLDFSSVFLYSSSIYRSLLCLILCMVSPNQTYLSFTFSLASPMFV